MPSITSRQDVIVLVASACFIGVYIGLIYVIGDKHGWHAPDPITHPDPNRFIPKPNKTCLVADAYNVDVRNTSKDCYGKWYYWQLPPAQATPLSRSIVWLLFAIHLVSHWILLYIAQAHKKKLEASKEEVYSGKLRWYNWALVLVTYVFYALHLVQSHTTYDALAKDVAIQSSQGSVIVALIFIMCIEYRDRGVFMGWPSQYATDRVAQRIYLSQQPMTYVRKYHGYAIAWAMIYTFWYHPMENTYGHATGTLHTFIVTIQGALVYQKIHLNKYWRLLLESWVWVHGALVARMVATEPWWTVNSFWMFFLGFGTLFFLTQVYTLPFWRWRGVSPWLRVVPFPVWLITVMGIILGRADIANGALMGLATIPLGQIACMFVTWLILYALQKLFSLCKVRPDKLGNAAGFAIVHCVVYGLFTVIFWAFQAYGTKIDLPFIGGTYVLVFICLFGICLSWFFAPLPDLDANSNEGPPASKVTPSCDNDACEVNTEC